MIQLNELELNLPMEVGNGTISATTKVLLQWGRGWSDRLLVRYAAAVIGWTNKAKQKFLLSSSIKTKLLSAA